MKMKMEVDVISKENIFPSSPTPHHLRNFKLSLLDQLIPAPYAPMVFFYPSANFIDIPTRLTLLKYSLSQTLTRFYPLAGKFKDDLTIDCNDEGANYVEAKVNCHLREFLSQPDLLLLHSFLPCRFVKKESSAGIYVTNIQVNVFECGGIAIGLCISHKALDGTGLNIFLKAWSTASARGSCEDVYPNFIATSLFPTNDSWLRDSSMGMWGTMFKQGKFITRRFLFDSSAISTLKAKATFCSLKNPTRVEVISALIWKSALAASKENNGFQKKSLLTHTVNLRKRITQPLLDYSAGNLLWLAAAQYKENNEAALNQLAYEVRKGISKIDADFVKKMRGDEGKSVMEQSLKDMAEFGSKDGAEYFGFTSWCKLGLYEADFGWGKPIWVSSIGLSDSMFMNFVILADTRLGDGIEAWVTLDEQDMGVLERELLTFASLDQSPLEINY